MYLIKHFGYAKRSSAGLKILHEQRAIGNNGVLCFPLFTPREIGSLPCVWVGVSVSESREPLLLTHQRFPAVLHRPLWWVWESSSPIVSQLKCITQMPLTPLMQFYSCQAAEGWKSRGPEAQLVQADSAPSPRQRAWLGLLGWSRTDLIICLHVVLCTLFRTTSLIQEPHVPGTQDSAAQPRSI